MGLQKRRRNPTSLKNGIERAAARLTAATVRIPIRLLAAFNALVSLLLSVVNRGHAGAIRRAVHVVQNATRSVRMIMKKEGKQQLNSHKKGPHKKPKTLVGQLSSAAQRTVNNVLYQRKVKRDGNNDMIWWTTIVLVIYLMTPGAEASKPTGRTRGDSANLQGLKSTLESLQRGREPMVGTSKPTTTTTTIGQVKYDYVSSKNPHLVTCFNDVYEIDGEPLNGTTATGEDGCTFWLKGTPCSTGTTDQTYREWECYSVTKNSFPADATGCWSTCKYQRLRVYDATHLRHKRAIDVVSDLQTTTTGGQSHWWETLDAQLSGRIAQVANNPKMILVLLAMVCLYLKIDARVTILILVMGGVYFTSAQVYNMGDHCVNPERIEVLKGTTFTEITMTASPGACKILDIPGTTRARIEFRATNLNSMKTNYKTIYTSAIASATSADRCPGDGEVPMPAQPGDLTICHRGFFPRGWHNGCFLMANGPVVTCASMTISEPLTIALLDVNFATRPLKIAWRGETPVAYNLSRVSPSLKTCDPADTTSCLEIICTDLFATYTAYYMVTFASNEVYLVEKPIIDGFRFPWVPATAAALSSISTSTASRPTISDVESMVHFGGVHAKYIDVSVATGMMGALRAAVIKNGIMINFGSADIAGDVPSPLEIAFPCRIITTGIKMYTIGTVAECTSVTATLVNTNPPVITTSGLISVPIAYTKAANSPACRLVVRSRRPGEAAHGTSLCESFTPGSDVAGANGANMASWTTMVRFQCAPGEIEISYHGIITTFTVPERTLTNWVIGKTAIYKAVSSSFLSGDIKGGFLSVWRTLSNDISSTIGSLFGVGSQLTLLAGGATLIWAAPSLGSLRTIATLTGLALMTPVIITHVGAAEYGCTFDTDDLKISCGEVKEIEWKWVASVRIPRISLTPNGIAYLPPTIRNGITILRLSIEAFVIFNELNLVVKDQSQNDIKWAEERTNNSVTPHCDLHPTNETELDAQHLEWEKEGKKMVLFVHGMGKLDCQHCEEYDVVFHEVASNPNKCRMLKIFDLKLTEKERCATPDHKEGTYDPEDYASGLKSLAISRSGRALNMECSATKTVCKGEGAACYVHSMVTDDDVFMITKTCSWGNTLQKGPRRRKFNLKGTNWPCALIGDLDSPITRKQMEAYYISHYEPNDPAAQGFAYTLDRDKDGFISSDEGRMMFLNMTNPDEEWENLVKGIKNMEVTHGHMISRMAGGGYQGWNCFPQLKIDNQKDTPYEMQIRTLGEIKMVRTLEKRSGIVCFHHPTPVNRWCGVDVDSGYNKDMQVMYHEECPDLSPPECLLFPYTLCANDNCTTVNRTVMDYGHLEASDVLKDHPRWGKMANERITPTLKLKMASREVMITEVSSTDLRSMLRLIIRLKGDVRLDTNGDGQVDDDELRRPLKMIVPTLHDWWNLIEILARPSHNDAIRLLSPMHLFQLALLLVKQLPRGLAGAALIILGFLYPHTRMWVQIIAVLTYNTIPTFTVLADRKSVV